MGHHKEGAHPKVLVLRPEGQGAELADLLTRSGMEAVMIPLIRIVPGDSRAIDQLLSKSDRFDWVVFTSANGVASVVARARDARLPVRFKGVVAIGPGTARKLEAEGFSVDWTPSTFTTSAIGAELPHANRPNETNGTGGKTKVAVVRADIAGTEMDDILVARDFEVTRVNAYRTEAIEGTRLVEELDAGVDAIAFTSASIVNAYVRAAGADTRGAAVCSIGPATSEALRSAGIGIDVEARIHSSEGMVEEIKKQLGNVRRAK